MTTNQLFLMGHTLLTSASEHLTRDDLLTAEFQALQQHMLTLCHKYHWPYLCAVQLGFPWQLAVVNIEAHNEDPRYISLINPKIKVLTNTTIPHTETCLSMPKLCIKIQRYQKIQLDYLNLSMTQCSIPVEDNVAARIQHVVDHLQGLLPIHKQQALSHLSYQNTHHNLPHPQPA